jgi:hypothetical protein
MCIAGDAVRNTGDAGSHMKILEVISKTAAEQDKHAAE